MRQLFGVPVADFIHCLRRTDTGLDLELDFFHKAVVFQHHALEQENRFLGRVGALHHRVQLRLRGLDGGIQTLLFPFGVERPLTEIFKTPY